MRDDAPILLTARGRLRHEYYSSWLLARPQGSASCCGSRSPLSEERGTSRHGEPANLGSDVRSPLRATIPADARRRHRPRWDGGYCVHMTTTVGAQELENALSRYLRLAAAGESIIVCDLGRPIAILAPAPDGSLAPNSNAQHLANLAARGLVTLGTHGRRRKPLRRPRADLSGAVRDDREQRK